jgi:hypothetical protein
VPVIGKPARWRRARRRSSSPGTTTRSPGRDTLNGNPPVEVVVPKSGVVAGVYVQAISAYAPHPNAAKLWMEYLYSDEGQLGWLKGYCHPIRFNDHRQAGKIPQELLDKLPPAAAYAKAVFPTLDEQSTRPRPPSPAAGTPSSAPTSSSNDQSWRRPKAGPAFRQRAIIPRPIRPCRDAARGMRLPAAARLARRAALFHLRAAVPDPADDLSRHRRLPDAGRQLHARQHRRRCSHTPSIRAAYWISIRISSPPRCSAR